MWIVRMRLWKSHSRYCIQYSSISIRRPFNRSHVCILNYSKITAFWMSQRVMMGPTGTHSTHGSIDSCTWEFFLSYSTPSYHSETPTWGEGGGALQLSGKKRSLSSVHKALINLLIISMTIAMNLRGNLDSCLSSWSASNCSIFNLQQALLKLWSVRVLRALL